MSAEDWLHSSDPCRAAAAWHALMDSKSCGEADRAALAEWLLQSPAHVREFMKIGAIRESLAARGVFDGIALEPSCGNNVAALPLAVTPAESGRDVLVRTGTGRVKLALAASLLLAVMAGGWWYLRGTVPGNGNFATQIGEQRSLLLADGSIAELNTRSTLEVQYSDSAREVVLGEGEALFRVVREAGRPFRVRSGDTIVQAVGTAFTVRRDADRTTVTVVEGRVSIEQAAARVSGGAPAPRVELGAGERIAVDRLAPSQRDDVQKVAAAAALAWRERRLVLEDLSLEQVVAEFNRYNVRQIQLESGAWPASSITGVFDANDPESFVSFLERRGDVSVVRDTAGSMRIRAAAGN